jgi:hypothetical protein
MHGAGSGGAGAGGGGYNGKKDPLEVRKNVEKQFLPKSASLNKFTERSRHSSISAVLISVIFDFDVIGHL